MHVFLNSNRKVRLKLKLHRGHIKITPIGRQKKTFRPFYTNCLKDVSRVPLDNAQNMVVDFRSKHYLNHSEGDLLLLAV